jgi:probable phosphoglycerate mutase
MIEVPAGGSDTTMSLPPGEPPIEVGGGRLGLVTTVRWARHGQSEANVSLTLSHRVYDPDLTDLGRRQAAELGERLAKEASGAVPVVAVAASPMRRARQTADVVAARLGLVVAAELEDLRELDVGSLDGRRDAEAWAIYHRVLAAWSAGDLTARFPGGEDGAELVARIGRGLRAAAALAAGNGTGDGEGVAVLVVAHGGNLRAALPTLTGAPEPDDDLPNGGWAGLAVGEAGDRSISLLDWAGR